DGSTDPATRAGDDRPLADQPEVHASWPSTPRGAAGQQRSLGRAAPHAAAEESARVGRPAELLVMCEKLRFVPRAGDDRARLRAGGARCSAAAQAVVQGVPGERLAPGRVTVAIEAGLPERLGLLLTIHGACLGSEPAACVSRAHHA